MIVQPLVNGFVKTLKEELITAEELKEIIDNGNGNGNPSDGIDTLEEAMRVYIEYLRDNIK